MHIISKLLRSKFAIKNEDMDKMDALLKEMLDEFASVSGMQEVRVSE